MFRVLRRLIHLLDWTFSIRVLLKIRILVILTTSTLCTSPFSTPTHTSKSTLINTLTVKITLQTDLIDKVR